MFNAKWAMLQLYHGSERVDFVLLHMSNLSTRSWREQVTLITKMMMSLCTRPTRLD
jgi:hypothetical protein